MKILSALSLILFSLEWNFSYSLHIQMADPTTKVAETDLQNYLRARHSRPKIHFKWLSAKYRNEKKAKFNFCDRTRGEKLHLCREVLESDEFTNIIIDGTRPDPTKCKRRDFTFLDMPQLPNAEGKQSLKMYPCITRDKPPKWFFLSGTGDPEPSLYLFHGIQDPAKNYPIYFMAKITKINMLRLADAREKEEKEQRKMWIDGPIATVDGAAAQGGLVPL